MQHQHNRPDYGAGGHGPLVHAPPPGTHGARHMAPNAMYMHQQHHMAPPQATFSQNGMHAMLPVSPGFSGYPPPHFANGRPGPHYAQSVPPPRPAAHSLAAPVEGTTAGPGPRSSGPGSMSGITMPPPIPLLLPLCPVRDAHALSAFPRFRIVHVVAWHRVT